MLNDRRFNVTGKGANDANARRLARLKRIFDQRAKAKQKPTAPQNPKGAA